MSKWFTADTHFGEERALKKHRRPFRDILEHDRQLIEAWNSAVNANDIVYHLGDFGDLNTVHHLNGTIKVVPGNHDDVGALLEAGVEVLEPWTVVEVKGLEVALTHDPFKRIGKKSPYFAFGHLHRVGFVRPDETLLGVNVGVEIHHFRLVHESELVYWFEILGRSGVILDGYYEG